MNESINQSVGRSVNRVGGWVSSFLTAHQHNTVGQSIKNTNVTDTLLTFLCANSTYY